MKSVFALASLFALVQAIPQGASATTEAAATSLTTPTCVLPCIQAVATGACATATDQAGCFCDPSNQAMLAACAVTACPSDLALLQQIGAQACPTGGAAAGAGAGAGGSDTTGTETGTEAVAPTETGAVEPTETGAVGTETGAMSTETGAMSTETGAAEPTEGGATPTNATGSAAPSATGNSGNKVAVGGSVVLAAFAALLAL